MTVRLKGRQRAVRAVIDDVRAWATQRDDVRAVVLVGSYARHSERMGSDVDLTVLTGDACTRRVLSDGHRVIYDTGVLASAVATL